MAVAGPLQVEDLQASGCTCDQTPQRHPRTPAPVPTLPDFVRRGSCNRDAQPKRGVSVHTQESTRANFRKCNPPRRPQSMLRGGSLAQGQKHKESLASPSVTETEAYLRSLSEEISVATMGSGPRGPARDTNSGVRLTPHVPAHVGFSPSSPVLGHHSQGEHFPKAAQHPSPFPAWSHIISSGSTQEKSPGVSEGTSQTKQLCRDQH